MSTVNGFQVGSETLKYNYESLENYNTPNFSTSLTYEVGDYVIYQGKLYKCSTAVETAGSWNSSNWTLAVLSDDVSDLKNAIDELSDTVINQGIHFFPDAMKSDIAEYDEIAANDVTTNARYGSAGNLITGATGFCAVLVNVLPYDQMYINGASVGYDGTYRVYLMDGDSIVSTLGVGENYTPYFTVPENVDNIRFTCTLNGYNQGLLVIKKLSYNSIASKDYVDAVTVKSLMPYTDLIITDNYRVGTNGTLISASGYYAIEFNVADGDIVWFFRSLLGYNSTFCIVLMYNDTVKSIITDTGITGQDGKYRLVVPSGVNKIKATGSMANKYPYNIFKEQLVDSDAITGNDCLNNNGQTTYIVGNGYFPSIQCACDFADSNDIIYIKNGTYTEQVSIWGKKLNLIGENKLTTILIDHSGAYSTPPLEMNLGSLSNMTIIEDGSSPTLQPGDSGYNGAYCLHIEWSTPANEVFEIDNCNFINYIHAPLGCGLYQDYTVRFKNCTFRCEATNEGNMERGAFYFHSNVNPNVTGQKIIAENCIISSAGQKWAVLLGVPSGANNTGSAEATFTGCDIWNDNLGTADSIAYFDTSGGTDVLKVVNSCGNTVGILNSFSTDIYAQVSQLSNAIDELDDALVHKFGDGGTVKGTLYDNSTGAVPPNTYSETRRWFFNRIFAANVGITSLKFDNYKLSSETTYFEIWEKNGNSLSKVKTVSIVTSGQTQFSVDINYSGNADYMLALVSTVGTVGTESRTGDWMLATTTISVDADSLNYSDLSVFAGFYPMVTIYTITTYTQRVILIGDGQQYSEIQDALEGITDDSADNPYTLVLLPKTAPYKPFSMLRSFDDPYPWSNIAPRYISIVGIDKAHCVVKSDSGDYRYPCCELMTNGTIKGIKFVMTNDAQESSATQGGYCAHIDCRTLNGVGYDMTLDDCDFESASGPCLGIGMHQNCKLTIRRCNLHTTLDASYNPHSGYRNLVDYGVIFCHTSTLATEENQQIVLEDCVGVCDEGRRSLWISTAGDYDISSGYFHYTLIQNVFWNNEQDAPAYDISSGLIADPANACNNLEEYEQSNAINQKQDATNYVTLSGTIVTQTGADNTMYLCGELAELTFTAPQTGITAIRFTSGTTPTVATFSGVTWLNGFDPTAIEASKTYEINILNGLGCAAWT